MKAKINLSPTEEHLLSKEEIKKAFNPRAKFKEDKYFFEQYKMAVDIFKTALDQEEKTNQFFSTANTILVMLLGIFFRPGSTQMAESFGVFFLSLIGIFMCLRWRFSIRYLEEVSFEKGEIASQVECLFPVFVLNIENKKNRPKSYLKGFLYKNVYYSFIIMYAIVMFYKIWELIR